MWRRPVVLLLLFSVMAADAPAKNDPVEISLAPAWNGFFRPGSYTELGIDLTTSTGGEAVLRIKGATTDIRYIVHLRPDTPLNVRIPLRPSAGMPVVVEISRSGVSLVEKQVRFHASRKPLVFRVGRDTRGFATSLTGQDPGFDLVHIGRDALPHTPQGYQSIDTLVIEDGFLGRLNRAQSQALTHFIGACGQLLLNESSQAAAHLKGRAGCGGRYLGWIAEQDAPIEKGRETRPSSRAMPEGNTLRRLLPETDPPSLQLILGGFFLVYGVIFLLVTHAVKEALILFAVPVAASLLLIPLATSPTQVRAAGWAEMEYGDRVARFSLVLRTDGNGSGRKWLGLPGHAALLPLVRDDSENRLLLGQQWPAMMELAVDNDRFSYREYLLSGVMTTKSPFALTLKGQTPVVRNTGDTTINGALLVWQDKIYRVPGLPPDDQWSPSSEDVTRIMSPEARVLNTRTGGDGAALLIEQDFAPDLFPGPLHATNGWLLVHAAGESAVE